MQIDDLRTQNFLRRLSADYNNSPAAFEQATGYSQNMVSQIKTGKKRVNDRLARKLEKLAKWEHLALDEENIVRLPAKGPTSWPFTVSPEEIAALPPKTQAEIDIAVTRMVTAALQEQIATRPRKRGNK